MHFNFNLNEESDIAVTTAKGREFQVSIILDWKENLVESRRTGGLTRESGWPRVIE